MRGLVSLAIIASLALGVVAVAQDAPDAPEAPSAGEALFVQKCGLCHLEGGFGTRVLSRRVPQGQALLQDRETLPAAFVTLVVRRGIGSMPQIRAAELDDQQLAVIARYLETGQ